jgi:SAM-dependent methyltransferase
MSPTLFFGVVTILFSLAAIVIVFSTLCLIRGGVLYIGSPSAVVRAMLAMADIKAGEKVFDLGCGDGRLLIPSVRKFKALATGIDISRVLLGLAWLRGRIWRTPVRLIHKNVLDADFSEANVVFIYLMPEILQKLQEPLKKLKPGCRIICHDFGLEGWSADLEMDVKCWLKQTRVFRYIVGAPAPVAVAGIPNAPQQRSRSHWPDSKMTSFY